MMKKRKHIVFLTGAGMSVESGISTFRDSGGLWEGDDPKIVASIEGWINFPERVQEFYNSRRRQLENVQPNEGHIIIAELEKNFDVTIITQNVDNLHERAGSTTVIHLHGELTKACNEKKTEVYEIGTRAIQHGEKAKDNSLLRPFIVWFGEAVPLINEASEIISTADMVVIVGTSMQVYPAANLIYYVNKRTPIYLIDPNFVNVSQNVQIIKEKATQGLKTLKAKIYESCF
ncbi:NAD-dependent protein deacylase [Bacteroidia bacterium]|nr:NAD-dependent protein deacylase [Bacteroidia bacterium]